MNNIPKLTTEIIQWIRNWFTNESGNAKGIIIGISGGKDSTIVAKLCCEAIGNDKVFGVLMPNGEQNDINDAIEVCKILDIRYRLVNINQTVQAFEDTIRYSGLYNDKNSTTSILPLSAHTKTNIAPRIRMSVLYAIGQEMNYRVVGTGNASERFIGYFTKWGDGACDFNPIGNLLTDTIIDIGDYLKLPYHLVHKTPADGLCGKTDEDNLGYSYDVVNHIVRHGTFADKGIERKVFNMHAYNLHKLKDIPMF